MATPPKDSRIADVEVTTVDEPADASPAAAPSNDREPVLRAERPVPSISRDELRAFLGRPSTQERIRRIVKARVGQKTPKTVVDEMIQEANIAVMTSKWAPRSLETARGWIGTVTVRAMVSYLRRGAKDRRWISIEQSAGGSTRVPVDLADSRPEGWLISKWLGHEVMRSERDQETLEILVYKARTSKDDEEIAAEHAMTVAALKSRVFQFREKYRPRLKQRRAMIVLSLGGVILAVAALTVWLLVHSTAAPAPNEAPVVPSAAPSSKAR